MKKLSVCLGLVLGLASPAAFAASIDVNYSLTGGFTSLGGAAGTVNFGVISTGTATVRYSSTATAPGSIVAGPAQLQTMGFLQQFTYTNLLGVTGATVTGQLGFTVGGFIPGSKPGTMSGGGALAFTNFSALNPLFVNCNAAACGLLGLTGFTGSLLTASTVIPVASLFGTGHFGTAPGVLGASVPVFTNLVTVPISFSVTGTELSRTFIPEPATGSLMALGLAGLAAAARSAHQRRR